MVMGALVIFSLLVFGLCQNQQKRSRVATERTAAAAHSELPNEPTKSDVAWETLTHRQKLEKCQRFRETDELTRELDLIGDEPFNYAAMKGDLKIMKDLISSGFDVNRGDPKYGITALLFAALVKQFSSAAFLLDHGANASLPSKDKFSPLHIACLLDDLRLAKFLVSRGANVNARTEDGMTPLMLAVLRGHEDIVRYFLEIGVELYHSHRVEGWNAMHAAVANEHYRIIIMLLNAGFDLNAIDKVGVTALDVALWKNDKEISKLFIAAARYKLIRLNDRNAHNFTPLTQAVMHNRTESVRSLLKFEVDVNQKYGDNTTVLSMAVVRNQTEIVKLLLKAGSNPNIKGNDGNCPLHIAALNNNIDIAKLLIASGADVNAQNNDGSTPLMIAALTNKPAFVRLLIPSAGDENRDLSLYNAVLVNDSNIVKLLLQAGSDPNTRAHGKLYQNVHGHSLLHTTVFQDAVDVAKLLIASGANVNAQNSDGWTPLMFAASTNKPAFVRLLLEHDANVHVRVGTGLTALHMARALRYPQIEQLLLEAGKKTGENNERSQLNQRSRTDKQRLNKGGGGEL